MARINECANVLAFLDMLAWSEGTKGHSDDGYNVVVGYGLFSEYADHPRRLIDLPRLGIKSTAAGRYQLRARYWDAYRKQLCLDDFSPVNQDRVAIQQIRERKAYQLVVTGQIEAAIIACSNIWASLPGAGYGQREHNMTDLLAKYREFGGALA